MNWKEYTRSGRQVSLMTLVMQRKDQKGALSFHQLDYDNKSIIFYFILTAD